ncbi:hypothetical protein, partial [Aggregatibacter actinomycetemcomitans]|uniref:hypothetical protein n=1 Tax=Aggregatibacter actinomycetemcomitans TaxID=714 RepID=UPI001E4F9959
MKNKLALILPNPHKDSKTRRIAITQRRLSIITGYMMKYVIFLHYWKAKGAQTHYTGNRSLFRGEIFK